MSRESKIQELTSIFRSKVQGKSAPEFSGSGHDGEKGHWLEQQFGIRANGSNAPDILGFELKNDTKAKTTFGDWSADRYIFDKSFGLCTRNEFLHLFGSPNSDGRYSWSGRPVPKVGTWNDFGQRLFVDEMGSIFAVYSFSKDKRPDKHELMPEVFRKDELALAFWSWVTLKNRVAAKFGENGWFKCLQDDRGTYVEIAFANPLTFQEWIDGVRKGSIFLDSGMKEDNMRPYSSWRADNSYWDSLIVSRFK